MADEFVVSQSPSDAEDTPPSVYNYYMFDDEHFKYSMQYQHKGLVVIINNANGFTEPRLQFQQRGWSYSDEDSLVSALRALGYRQDDILRENNRSRNQMLMLLGEVANRDFTDYASLIVVVMSYGDDGVVMGTDERISYNELLLPFRKVSTLFDKPKFFLIQTERCENEDIAHDALPPPLAASAPVISDPDVLVAFNLDYRHLCCRTGDTGTWFIQRVAEVLERDAVTYSYDRLDLANIMTRVNQLVRIDMGGYAQRSRSDRFACPRFITFLTKDFKFAKA